MSSNVVAWRSLWISLGAVGIAIAISWLFSDKSRGQRVQLSENAVEGVRLNIRHAQECIQTALQSNDERFRIRWFAEAKGRLNALSDISSNDAEWTECTRLDFQKLKELITTM